MKYEESIVIDVPISRVVELFDSEENMFKWQKGLTSVEQLSGTAGEPGAKSRMTFQMGKKTLDLVETIVNIDLPKEFSATYETKGVFNVMNAHFEELSPEQTRWVSHNEFRFDSWFMRIMSGLMKGAFRKQSCEFMQAFKDFAENDINVNQSA